VIRSATTEIDRRLKMGRYYSGDIDGKFWFGLQSSDAADRFGVNGQTPDYLEYYFDKDNIGEVEAELKSIKEKLGKNYDLILKAQKEYKSGSFVDDLAKVLDVTKKEATSILSEFADYELGEEILKCLQDKGDCQFNAEL